MFALAIALAASLMSAPPDAGRIAGRVVDARTRAGVAGASVALDGGAASARADDEGRFVFAGVSPGLHTLTAAVPGFSPSLPLDVVVSEGAPVQVEIMYSLGLSTEVRGNAEPAPAPAAPIAGGGTLRGRDIAAAVGGLDDVGRVLQLQPGVVASQDDRNDLIVRGGGALESQVVADGFELPTASHFGAAGSASGGISLVPSDVIQQAAISIGGFSAAYGERASSLVEIDLLGPVDRRLSGTVSAGAGGILGLARGSAGRGGGWLASARRSILEMAFSRGNTRAVPRYRDLFGRLVVPLTPAHEFRVMVLGASDSADVNPIGSARSAIRDEQFLALVGLGLRSRWGAATRTSFSVSLSTNETNAYRTTSAVIDGRERAREGELRLRADVRRAFGRRLDTAAGATFRRTAVSFDLQDNAYRNEWGTYIPALKSSWRDRVGEPAAYAEATATVIPGVRVTAGLRAERPGTSGTWAATPRLRAEYDAAPGVRLAGSWGVYRQAIPFIWIASWPGNAGLEPIRCSLGTAGAEVRGPLGVRVAAEAWIKRYDGYPVDPAEPPHVLISAATDYDVPFVGRLVGAGLVHASGIDATVSRRFAAAEVAASYSHWRVVQRGLDMAWRRADFDIRHQARVITSWRPSPRWSLSASWRHASGRPYTPFDTAASIRAGGGRYDRGRTNTARYSPYDRADLRVERIFVARRALVTAFAELMNLADHDNIYIYTWSRSAKAPDPVFQWGRTPVAGVRVEF